MWLSRRTLVLSLILGIVAGIACLFYLRDSNAPSWSVVAARDIPPHTRIEASWVELKPLPAKAKHPQALSDLSGCVRQCARIPITQGSQIPRSILYRPGEGPDGVVGSLGPEQRGFMIPARPSHAVGGMLRPGHLVDVIHFYEGGTYGPMTARLLLSGLRVIDVRSEDGEATTAGSRSAPGGVVVAVSVEQTEKLVYALATGHVSLALCPYNMVTPETSGITGTTLFHSSRSPEPTFPEDAPVDPSEDEWQ